MANKDNKLSGLEIPRLMSQHFDEIFKIQNNLQKRMKCDFESMSLKQIVEFNFKNNHAFQDEVCEMMDALGGINDGVGNAGWKWWKKDYISNDSKALSELSDSDLLELKFEVVDMFHFFINTALSVGMTGSELFSMYLSKNKENIKRQENGY